jgi:hypothetical protein
MNRGAVPSIIEMKIKTKNEPQSGSTISGKSDQIHIYETPPVFSI